MADYTPLDGLEQVILEAGHDSQVYPLTVQEIAQRIRESDWLAAHDAQVTAKALEGFRTETIVRRVGVSLKGRVTLIDPVFVERLAGPWVEVRGTDERNN